MAEIYEIRTPDGYLLDVNKETHEIIFNNIDKSKVGRYTKRYSKAILEAHNILTQSPYKDYQYIDLDPNCNADYLEFKRIQKHYYQEPLKGAISPWSKKEKAYYESLKTKRERYQYLTLRSGLRSTIIDIPYEAYAGVDEKGQLRNKEYEHLYKEVEKNRGYANLSYGFLPMGEWNLAAGILGDRSGFAGATELFNTGFKARAMQAYWLYMQLGGSLRGLPDIYAQGIKKPLALGYGLVPNLKKKQFIELFIKNPPYDEFGMLPYLDELIGVDWVLDCNEHDISFDSLGNAIAALCRGIEEGKLMDPRDPQSTPQSRLYFNEKFHAYRRGSKIKYNLDVSNEWDEHQFQMHLIYLYIDAKIAALTPPQGYPNAPRYIVPEGLEEIYKKGVFDRKKWDPTIPTIQRSHFPEFLRKKIENYAKKHNIKD